ncbi:MAG: GreA/GreB family elongation factor [Clostridia bacterium]|nr:GreA/GreB family elongation factor [Clostridia bacterium]
MRKELTEVEIKQIKEEIKHRQEVTTPTCIAEVQRTRALGDLSENDEYRSAKRELNRNYSRLRYLKAMLDGAVVITDDSDEFTVGLFDHVTYFDEDEEEEVTVTLVTPLRNDVLKGNISKDSPLGKALMGKKEGDRAEVRVNEKYSYFVKIISLEKGEDDESFGTIH